MKRILKAIISSPKKILDKIIDEEAKRVEEFNEHIFCASRDRGGED